jgi:hypothetical protein
MCRVSILKVLSEYMCLSIRMKDSMGTPSVVEEKLTTLCSFSLKSCENRASKYWDREPNIT